MTQSSRDGDAASEALAVFAVEVEDARALLIQTMRQTLRGVLQGWFECDDAMQVALPRPQSVACDRAFLDRSLLEFPRSVCLLFGLQGAALALLQSVAEEQAPAFF